MLISSPSNPRVKAVRALGERKERDRTGLFFAEGIRIVASAVEAGAELDSLVVAPAALRSELAQELVQDAVARGVRCLEVTPEVFASLSRRERPQGIGAVVRQRWDLLDDVCVDGAGVWVALDRAQDPGNIGTIVRTCDAVGGEGAILLGPSADPYDSGAVRASMGSIFWQRMVRADFATLRDWSRRAGYALVAATLDAQETYTDARYPARCVLVMGAEREGLAREQQAACDLRVRIPMTGHADSLNLAVSTAVILFEMRRQGLPPASGPSTLRALDSDS